MVVKYTVAAFRANLRKAFNLADDGRTILIERYGQTYRLSALMGEPQLHTGTISKRDTKEDDGSEITDDLEGAIAIEEPDADMATEVTKVEQSHCKNGHVAVRGTKCAAKGCKHSVYA